MEKEEKKKPVKKWVKKCKCKDNPKKKCNCPPNGVAEYGARHRFSRGGGMGHGEGHGGHEGGHAGGGHGMGGHSGDGGHGH